jgi:hypothetical protein
VHQSIAYRGQGLGEQAYGHYLGVSRLAVVSLAAGVLSILTIWHWMFLVIPLAAVAVGWIALLRIRDYPSELTGRWLAIAGILVAAAFALLGVGYVALAKVGEVPFGYDEISYEQLQPDPDVPGERIPQKMLEYQDQQDQAGDQAQTKKVFLRGFMDGVRRQSGIKVFVLCPTLPGECAGCPDPKPTEMIRVELQENLTAHFTPHEIHVGGRLKVDPTFAYGTPYLLKADYLMQPR